MLLRTIGAALRGTARTLTSIPRAAPTSRGIASIFIGSNDISNTKFNSQRRYASSFLTSAPLHLRNYEWSRFSTLFSETSPLNSILSTESQVSRVPTRTLTKFSRYKGKRYTVKTVLKRFYRLDWGMWIRTKAGRHKRLWKKRAKRKMRLRRHVMTTASQSYLLDTMVTKYWRRPKYYVDDPYNPYHKRESFSFTRTKPLP